MSEFIEFLSPKAKADLELANAELVKMLSNMKNINQNTIAAKTPSGSDSALKALTAEYEKQQKVIQDLQKPLTTLTQKQNETNQSTKKQVQSILDQSKSYQSLTRQKEQAIKQSEREALAVERAGNLYNQTQQKVNQLSQSYNNLAIKKELGQQLTLKEQIQLEKLTNEINIYQTALKKVDADIQKNQRNVGNYASGWNGLGNSINQLSREMPAFANSVQTGFMALSNNIPILFDEISRIKETNKELIAQGQPVKSVFSQIAGAVLSWGTALSVGVTLLTVFGPKIWDMVSGSKATKKALEEEKKVREEKANIEKQAYEQQVKYASDEQAKAKILLETAKNLTLSMKERENAVTELQQRYPTYLGYLSKEQILAGDTADAEFRLNDALMKRAMFLAVQDKIIEKTKELVDAEMAYVKTNQEAIKTDDLYDLSTQKKITSKQKLRLVNEQDLATTKGLEAVVKSGDKTIKNSTTVYNEKTLATRKQLDILYKLLNGYAQYANTVVEDTKNTKNKTKETEKEIESEYNLKLAILERQKAERNDRATNEVSLFEDRIKARKEYSDKSIEILELEAQKEKALIQEKYLDDLDKNNLAYKNKDINSQEWSKNIQYITKRTNNELATIDLSYSLKWNNLLNENAKFYRDIQDKNREYTEQTNNLILDGEKSKYEKISNDSKKTLTLRQKAFEQYIKLSEKELEIQKIKDLANAKSNEEIILISQKYADAMAKLGDLSSPMKKATEATEEYISKLSSSALENALNDIGLSSAKMFLDFDANGQSTFDKLLEGADTFKEKFAVTFQAVGDVAQDIFNNIAEISNQRYEQQLINLQRERENAILFAGESATAREEIERQYEEKRREIQRRQAEAQKKQAMFQIGVQAVQGSLAAYLSQLVPGDPTSIVRAKIAAAVTLGLGLANLAMVASQQIPQFAEGTDNAPKGWAWTQEEGREIITDRSGRIKSMGSDGGAKLTYLNSGDKVYTNTETEQFYNNLNNQLIGNDIAPIVIKTAENDFLGKKIDKLANIISNKESIVYIRDANGENYYRRKKGEMEKVLNARINIKGYDV